MFIAVELPPDVKAALTGTAWSMPDFLRPAVRWSQAQMMHLTLRFLGDTEPDLVEAIAACMREASERSARFTLRLDDTGAFPAFNQPRVFWVGIAGEIDRLGMLHTRIEGSLAGIGIATEDRRYNPHLTVGRLQSQVPPFQAAQVGQAFAHAKLPDPRPQFLVDSLVLFRSQLQPDGPRYEELARASLA
ncbi:MAG: RNA 2',3'-cyclic phosphodiesterase [Chloroflexi bacterium]|nr:RNA 2',3'-cyclic phosphodiesterase [Chloroflexota bacterium]